MLVTSGLDFGARSVKIAILSHRGTRSVVLAKSLVRTQRNRDTRTDLGAIRESWGRVLADAGLSLGDIDCVASTGSRECQTVRVGPFYQRFSHALGASLLFPDAAAALDIARRFRRISRLSDPVAADPLAQRLLSIDRPLLN